MLDQISRGFGFFSFVLKHFDLHIGKRASKTWQSISNFPNFMQLVIILDECCALRQKLLTITEVPKFWRAGRKTKNHMLSFKLLLKSIKKTEKLPIQISSRKSLIYVSLRTSRVGEFYYCHNVLHTLVVNCTVYNGSALANKLQ